jgi:hypothetical protein
MLSKMAAALAHGLDDGGEVVIGQDHLGRLLLTSVPVMPMAMPMSADFERGGVVDAIAGHRDDVALRLQGIDDAQLVRGRDTGIDRGVRTASAQFSVIQCVEIGTGEGAGPGSTMPRSVAMRAAVRG